MEKKREILDIKFSVFNCHINDALDKASIAFIKDFGAIQFAEVIAPIIHTGIMSIFHEEPNEMTLFFVKMIQDFVNEGTEGYAPNY